MTKFIYKASNAAGKILEGDVDATSKKEAVQQLKTKGYLVYSVREESSHAKQAAASSKQSKKDDKGHSLKSAFQFGSDRKLALGFLKRLLQLYASGIPIGDAIKILQQRVTDPKQKEIAVSLWRDLSEGISLTTSMRKFPHVFNDSIICPLEAGEATGNLAPVIKEIVAYLENQEEMKKRIMAGLSYPIFVCVMALGVVALFLFFLLPRIQGMMSTLGGKMNWSAKLLIGSAEFALKGGPFIVVGLIIGFALLVRWKKTEVGRHFLDKWFLKLPFFGKIFYRIDVCQVSNLMYTLLSSGINVTEAMRLVERAIKNTLLRSYFQTARVRINDGMAFSVAFKNGGPFFSDLAIDILSVGESTGSLVKCFSEIYAIYKEELDQEFKTMTNLISGLALSFAFALVAILALSIVMSILQFSSTLVMK